MITGSLYSGRQLFDECNNLFLQETNIAKYKLLRCTNLPTLGTVLQVCYRKNKILFIQHIHLHTMDASTKIEQVYF